MGNSRNLTRLLDQELKESIFILCLFSLTTLTTAILALLSLPLNILSTIVVVRCKSQVPPVVRRFIIIYNVAFLQRLIMINWKWLYQICLLFISFEKMRFPAILCRLLNVLYSSTYYVFAVAMFGMSLERFVTSFCYTNILQIRIFTAVCAIMGWSIPLSKIIIEIVQGKIMKGQAPYCQSMLIIKRDDANLDATSVAVIAQLVLTLISLCLMCYIRWLNKKRLDQFNLMSTTHSLASRFTLWSNFNTAKWLIPVTLISLMFRMASEITALIFQVLKDTDAHSIGMDSCSLLLAAVESFVYPVALFRYNESFALYLLDMDFKCLIPGNCLLRWITGRKANAVGIGPGTKQRSRAGLNTVDFRLKPEQNLDIVLRMWEKVEPDLKGYKVIRG